MHAITGIILAIVALSGLYYMYQAGMFEPLTGIVGDVSTGFRLSYGEESRSVYYREVRIRFVSLGPDDPESPVVDQVAIVAHPKTGGVKVTGWTIKTDKGSFKIPQTYNVYSPSTKDAAPEDIFMRDGDRLTLYGGKSPNGRNERVAQGEYRVWLGDFLKDEHGKITLRDERRVMVDEFVY